MPTTARAPAATASVTAATKPAAGTHTTARSTGAPWAARGRLRGGVRRPAEDLAACRLTISTVRSPRDARARGPMMWPHLAESSLAPMTATVRGANRASSRSGGAGPGPLTRHAGKPSIA